MTDELVQAIRDLKPQDVQEVLKKRIHGQLQLMVLPKK
jgi:predicted Zn-dependent peptidase